MAGESYQQNEYKICTRTSRKLAETQIGKRSGDIPPSFLYKSPFFLFPVHHNRLNRIKMMGSWMFHI